MITFLIDFSLICIVAFCAWRGYRNGLIRGAFGVVTLIISLFLANIIANAYSEEFTGALTPFAGGIMDTALSNITSENIEIDVDDPDSSEADSGLFGFGNIDFSNIDLSDIDLSDIDFDGIDLEALGLGDIDLSSIDINELDDDAGYFLTTFLAMRYIGIPEAGAASIAKMTAEDETDRYISDVIADNISIRLSYIALFGISLLILIIIFTVIGNLIGFIFTLPGLKLVDIIAGIAFGLIKGILIVLALTVVIRYFGLLAYDTVEGTSVLKFFVNNNLIANMLGV